MFEHLSPKVRQSSGQKRVKLKVYSWFLLSALFIFASAWGLTRGTGSNAQNNPQITAAVYTTDKYSDNQVVLDTPKLTVFDFVIKTNSSQIFLNQLNIQVSGVYNEEWLADLLLYNQGTQLGQITNLGDGQLHFDIGHYQLQNGENYFQLRLNHSDNLSLADAATFTINSAQDIILFYLDHPFTPEGVFPISSRKFSVIEQGQLLAYNNLVRTNFSVPIEKNELLADFSFSSQKETVTLKQVVINVESNNPLLSEEFYLSYQGGIIAKAVSEDNQLSFSFTEPIIVRTDQDLNLSLWSNLTSEGEYSFKLAEVLGQGFISGKAISLNNELLLSKVKSLANMPYFTADKQSKLLSDGWNSLYQLKVINPASQALVIDKLTWQLDNFGVQITALELWVDNEPYQVNLTLNNNIVTADFTDQPLKVDSAKEVLLMVKVQNLADKTRLQANLLNDSVPDKEQGANLLWSIVDEQFNGYLLPNFPLAPAILSN